MLCHDEEKPEVPNLNQDPGPDYMPCLEAIKSRLEEEGKLRIIAVGGEPRRSKSLLHGDPTSASMGGVALSIQQSYPGALTLGQTPRWLTMETKRQASVKGMNTVVLAIARHHILQSLGYQYLYVCSSRCRLGRYLPYGRVPSAGNCCKFGHQTTLCQGKVPIFGGLWEGARDPLPPLPSSRMSRRGAYTKSSPLPARP